MALDVWIDSTSKAIPSSSRLAFNSSSEDLATAGNGPFLDVSGKYAKTHRETLKGHVAIYAQICPPDSPTGSI
jgi:hypothetical protein